LGLTEPWTRPWSGETLSVDATSLPLSIAVLATGFSDQTYSGTPLPLSLAPFGMPQCYLRVAPDVTQWAAGTGGTATFQILIPSTPALVGLAFWQQAFALAPGANPAGLLVSDSMSGTVGRSH